MCFVFYFSWFLEQVFKGQNSSKAKPIFKDTDVFLKAYTNSKAQTILNRPERESSIPCPLDLPLLNQAS